jgi:hypothetical protein
MQNQSRLSQTQKKSLRKLGVELIEPGLGGFVELGKSLGGDGAVKIQRVRSGSDTLRSRQSSA